MIAIHHIDENMNVLAEFADPGIANALALDFEKEDGACLRFIDPWGDTYFNQCQLPVLSAEIEARERREHDSALRLRLKALRDFVEGASGQIHTYLRFVGE